MFAQSCPNCRGVCPRDARVCKYCKFRFEAPGAFSLDRLLPRGSMLRIAVIILAIVMVVVLVVMNVLHF
jgi:hypothetical protein